MQDDRTTHLPWPPIRAAGRGSALVLPIVLASSRLGSMPARAAGNCTAGVSLPPAPSRKGRGSRLPRPPPLAGGDRGGAGITGPTSLRLWSLGTPAQPGQPLVNNALNLTLG